MYLIVIDNPEKAKELLKTNREIKIGDKFSGDKVAMSAIAAKNKDVFSIEGQEVKEVKVVKKKTSKKVSKKNKRYSKGKNFKSKD